MKLVKQIVFILFVLTNNENIDMVGADRTHL